MRYLAVIAVVSLLAGASAATSTARPTRPPFRLGGMLEGNGMLGLRSTRDGGELLRYVPKAHFAVGVVLENTSGQRIAVTDARVLEPQRTLVHQIGTQFYRWSPPKCPQEGDIPCPPRAFPLHASGARPQPLTVKPRRDIGVALDFRLGSCAEIPTASSTPISRLRVTFRLPTGRTHVLVLPLARANLHLRMPKPEDCAQPRSDLKIQAPDRLFTYSEWTKPGSTGDVCSVAGRTLRFRSRLFLLYARERVYLRLTHFTGRGEYDDGIVTLVARGQTVFRTEAAKLRVTTATSHRVVAHLFAGHYAHHHERSVPFLIQGTLRCRVRG